MRTIFYCLMVPVVAILMAMCAKSCAHRNDYKVAADDLKVIGSNLIGDVKAVVLSTNDTVFVYGKYSPSLFEKERWQTRWWYLEFDGFTSDSVIVTPCNP